MSLLLASSAALELSLSSNYRVTRQLASEGLASRLANLQAYTLHDFARDFGRDYVPGTEEWAARERTYEENKQKVGRLMSLPSLSWTPGITQFMDYTKEEYSRLLGYRGRRGSRGAGAGSSKINPLSPSRQVANLIGGRLPAEFFAGRNGTVSSFIRRNGTLTSLTRDQGACGSCWAAAAASVLEGALEHDAELLAAASAISKKQAPTVSSQAIVSCTPNPRHCGGSGGCDGATAELAYEMVQKRGLPLAVAWPYQSGSGRSFACKDSLFKGPRLGIKGYTVLPQNKLEPLKNALVTTGAPIVISVDATNWNYYRSGIYGDTSLGKGDFTVNHAVTLMGYKEKDADSLGYWLIKNSWGESFGERGYIRVELKEGEESHCGWDEDTHVGLACDGDPDRAWVCGTCGILYDSSFPTGLHVIKNKK